MKAQQHQGPAVLRAARAGWDTNSVSDLSDASLSPFHTHCHHPLGHPTASRAVACKEGPPWRQCQTEALPGQTERAAKAPTPNTLDLNSLPRKW